jgi:hypothetical protein
VNRRAASARLGSAPLRRRGPDAFHDHRSNYSGAIVDSTTTAIDPIP